MSIPPGKRKGIVMMSLFTLCVVVPTVVSVVGGVSVGVVGSIGEVIDKVVEEYKKPVVRNIPR